MAGYWKLDDLNLTEDLNREIWEQSPQIQCSEIGIPTLYGAQQAMIGSDVVLPWVPDLVGKSLDSEGLTVCGSAYAGFISPYSGRNGHCVTVPEYRQPTAEAFQRIYVNKVVEGGDRYYGRVESLLDGISPLAQTLVMDLCRASFVERGTVSCTRLDKSGDGVVTKQAARAVFETYLDAPTPSQWLWKRISGDFGTRILALGSIAEHGILRLLAKHGMAIFIGGIGPVRFNQSDRRCMSGEWVRYYAGDLMNVAGRRLQDVVGCRVTLQYWIDNGSWWTVRNPSNPEIEWRVLPAFHPTAQSSSRIGCTRALLNRML